MTPDREGAPSRVVVVGAGIAGLAAAYAVHRDAPAGTVVVVLDAASQLGGKLRVSPVAGWHVDEGAETFLARVPEAVELARAVGLGGSLVHPVTTSAAVVVGGVARALPTGTMLGVPTDLAALRAAAVLSPAGLAAVEAEPALPAEPLRHDVSVGDYVGRRLGREVVERLVDPLLGGVYAGRAELLSLAATMPALARALTEAVPLLAAARAALGSASAERAGGPADPVFATLRSGLGSLPAAVAAAVTHNPVSSARRSSAEIRLNLPVRRVERTSTGFRLVAGPVPRPTVLEADAVVVATPAGKAAALLAELVPAASAELAGIDYASMAIVTLAYPPGAASQLAGSGLLVPATEGKAVKAVTFSSVKWAHLAGGPVVLRASVGRYGEEHLLQRTDEELVELVAAEVAGLTGLNQPPVEARATRWGGGLPQYAVGHLDRVDRIRAAVTQVPGLAVCGAVYDGVGVPACIRSGYAAAAVVTAHLAARAGQESADRAAG